MVQPNANHHTYEPRPQQMIALSKDDIYFAVGTEFESAILRRIVSSVPDIVVVYRPGHCKADHDP